MWYAFLVVAFICLYIVAFAWSWGPLGWLVPSEILPLEIRSAGQSINVGVNMICTFVIAQIFLQMLCALRYRIYNLSISHWPLPAVTLQFCDLLLITCICLCLCYQVWIVYLLYDMGGRDDVIHLLFLAGD